MKKIPAKITSLYVNTASYSQAPVAICPTFINFFFGNNGSGKSTIAKSIKHKLGITWQNSSSDSDCKIYAFDQDYIRDNLSSYDNLPGVFTFDKENIQIQDLVNNLIRQKDDLSSENETLLAVIASKNDELSEVRSVFLEACWSKAQSIRNDFPQTVKGKLKKTNFADEILNVKNPSSYDLSELGTLYNTAYSNTVLSFEKFNVIQDTAVLDNIPNTNLISKKIVSSSDTPFADYIKALNNTAWVKQGMEHYHTSTNKKCPFCQQQLPDTFEEDIRACFDEQFKKETSSIDQFKEAYRNTANNLFASLQKIPNTDIADTDLSTYKNKLDALKGVLSENIEIIANKQKDYSITYSLKPTKQLLEELSVLINSFNAIIEKHNEIVATKPVKKLECKNKIWQHIAYLLKDETKAYSSSLSTINYDLEVTRKKIQDNEQRIRDLNRDISSNLKNIVNTQASIESINALLKDSGFQGFSLREKPKTPNVYEVIRNDGSIATNLSEGEKNFIAFLYFYHQVKGSNSPDDKSTNKIVVVDDPVSSMDSGTLFIVSALIREMICICENNVDQTDNYVKDRYIKQLFVLTHNTYFHKEITYDRVKNYPFVNFYLVSKTDNKSSIRLCERTNPEAPSDMMNYNPVQNAYSALWEEYKVLSTPIPLINVIRRILEYYFLQLCGYDGSTLRDVILKKNKEKFIKTADTGCEDYSNYQLASAMLSYIQAKDNSGIIDGISYIDDCINIGQAKETFKMIFYLMNQGQHYEMMMHTNLNEGVSNEDNL